MFKQKILLIVLNFLIICLSSCRNHLNNENKQSELGYFFKEEVYQTDIVNIRYCFYGPNSGDSNLPLIVYLHGGSDKGDDLSLLYDDGFPMYIKEKKLEIKNSYVLIPQLPSNKNGWVMIGDAIIELIEYICDLFDINEEKIALTGHSMGGTGTWDLALLYPNKFLRIAPLSGSVKITTENINQLKHLQIRAYVGSKDTIVSPESSRKMIYELQQYHTDAEIIIFENATHFDIPQLAYLNDKELIQWLIS